MSPMGDPRLLVVIPAHDAADWYRRNLSSLFEQEGATWRAIYIDDCSTDGTGRSVERFVAQRGFADRVEVVRARRRLWPARARRLAYTTAAPDDVVCMLDGDDWLARPDALARVARAHRSGVECTYGRYVPWSGRDDASAAPVPAYDFPPEIVAARRYRDHPWISSHLRTVRARHLHSIPRAELRDHQGGWLRCCTDNAEMWWALEQTEGRHALLPETLYVYNQANSRRYATSWYRRGSEPAMADYRVQVHRMLRRQGPALSLCVPVAPADPDAIEQRIARLVRAVAPLGDAVELVIVLFGEATLARVDPLAARWAAHGGRPAIRFFASPAAWSRPFADDIARDLASGRRVVCVHADEDVDALAPSNGPISAPTRRGVHAELVASGRAERLDEGPYPGGRWVRPVGVGRSHDGQREAP